MTQLLDIYSKNMKTLILKDIYIPVFTAALCTTAKKTKLKKIVIKTKPTNKKKKKKRTHRCREQISGYQKQRGLGVGRMGDGVKYKVMDSS